MSAAHNYELGQVIYVSALLVFREDLQSLRTKAGFVHFALWFTVAALCITSGHCLSIRQSVQLYQGRSLDSQVLTVDARRRIGSVDIKNIKTGYFIQSSKQTTHQFLQSKTSLNSTHALNLSSVSTSYCNVTSIPLPSLCLGGQMKQRPSGLPSGFPIEHLNASLQPSAGPKSMWLNLEAFRQTISMSGPGQRSTFQVREVALSIWLRRPTRRRTAVESTAAMACLMRAAAVASGGGDGVVRGVVAGRFASSDLTEIGPAVDEVDDAVVVGVSQKARVGMRATCESTELAMLVDCDCQESYTHCIGF